MDSLISVVIPTYNYANYVRDAVESVLNQSYKEFEIIVVDDGSTDDTKKVLEPLKKRIRYIYQENKGLPSAYNTGIKSSRGDYVAFLDSDDLWLPKKLELQKKFFDENPSVGMVICNGYLFNETGIISTFFPVGMMNPLPDDLHGDLFLRNVIPGNTPLIRKQCFDRIGLHDESLTSAEDLDLWIRLTRYFTVGYVPQPLVKYRKHGNSMSMNLERMCENKIKVLRKNIALFPDILAKKPEIKKRISDIYFELALSKIKKLKLASSLKQMMNSIRYRPFWLTPLVYIYYTKLR